MHGPDGVVKAIVDRSRVNVMGQPELGDAAQALDIAVVHQIKAQRMAHGNKTVDRVVDDFVLVLRPHLKAAR